MNEKQIHAAIHNMAQYRISVASGIGLRSVKKGGDAVCRIEDGLATEQATHQIRLEVQNQPIRASNAAPTVQSAGAAEIIAVGVILLLSSCASPRYDSQGNGTWPIDRIERAAVHAVNQEHY